MASVAADRPHHIQVRLAFGGHPDHPPELGVLLSSEGSQVLLSLVRDGSRLDLQVGEPERLAAVLGRPDLCRLDGRPLALVNRRFSALALAAGPPVPPDHLVVSGAVCRLEDGAAVEIPAADGQPGWHTFVAREVRGDPDAG